MPEFDHQLWSTFFGGNLIDTTWGLVTQLSPAEHAEVLTLMEMFSGKLKAIADELVNERVQIHGIEKPLGAISQQIPPMFARVLASSLADKPMTFPVMVYTCYFVYWKVVELGLNDLSKFCRIELKTRVQKEFDDLVAALRRIGQSVIPLVTVLTTVSTATRTQCDAIADWFRLPGTEVDEKYTLSSGIEIAKAATMNVHRAFPVELSIDARPEEDLPLSTSALAVLSDCIFVIFENAWKHSGLEANVGVLNFEATFDAKNRYLQITVRSDIATHVRQRLLNGELARLRKLYLGDMPIELVRREGGSGFAKLARLTHQVDRGSYEHPLDFGVKEDRWYTTVTIPLYLREVAYDAYE